MRHRVVALWVFTVSGTGCTAFHDGIESSEAKTFSGSSRFDAAEIERLKVFLESQPAHYIGSVSHRYSAAVTQRSLADLALHGYYGPEMLHPDAYRNKRVLNVGCGKAVYDAQRMLQNIDWYALDLPRVLVDVQEFFAPYPNLRGRFLTEDFTNLSEGTTRTFEHSFDIIESTFSLFHGLAVQFQGPNQAKVNEENKRWLEIAFDSAYRLLKPNGVLRISFFTEQNLEQQNLLVAASNLGFEPVVKSVSTAYDAQSQLKNLLAEDNVFWKSAVLGAEPHSAACTIPRFNFSTEGDTVTRAAADMKDIAHILDELMRGYESGQFPKKHITFKKKVADAACRL